MSRSVTYRLDSRLTGLFYLGLAVAGGFSFMLVRPILFAEGDAEQTLANLIEKESLARIGVALELGTATFQALAAVWFARLFREADAFASGAIAAFGMVNAVAVLASAAMLGAALDMALSAGSTGAEAVQVLYSISNQFWRVGNIFFGLWLIPMGWACWQARFGPRILGWILICGGVGYVVNAFVAVLVPDIGLWSVPFLVIATVGEFWMIGLLLWTGFRPMRMTVATGASQSG
jgi:hypothetical protein